MDGSIPSGAGAPAIRDDFIPAEAYLSPELVKLEKERLWPKVWQMACRVEEIPKVGDFVSYKTCDDTILITRTAEDRIQAFYNVCQHRGRKLRDEERGHASQWFCRFHGWRWSLDGTNTYVHDREDWASHGCPIDEADVALKQVKVAAWAGWVWINQDPDCEPLRQYLGPAAETLDPFEYENARIVWHETIIAPVNWKVVCEAFNESYHAVTTHISGWRNLISSHSEGFAAGRHNWFRGMPYTDHRAALRSAPEYQDPVTGEWKPVTKPSEGIWAYHLHLCKDLKSMTLDPLMSAAERLRDEAGPDYPPEKLAPRLRELHIEELARRGVEWPKNLTPEAVAKAGTDWHIFPNSIVLPTADSALWYRPRPNGDDPNSCIFDIWSLGRFAPGQEPKVVHGLSTSFDDFRGKNSFLEEDFGNMEAVHEGMKCRGWSGARVNPLQERQIAHFHRVLQAYCYGDGWKDLSG
jgi:nitrite reductase/ring-hydroxylating ferredoxin subunit